MYLDTQFKRVVNEKVCLVQLRTEMYNSGIQMDGKRVIKLK